MEAFAIVIEGHMVSEQGFDTLVKSSIDVGNNFSIDPFPATTPIQAHEFFSRPGSIRWTWPWDKAEFDLSLGVKKIPYPTNNPLARVACFLSHYTLWQRCDDLGEPILILEHDAKFTCKMSDNHIAYGAVSLNSPLGCTRKAQVYHDKIQKLSKGLGDIVPAPWVDADYTIVQGLPGNSAYIISPSLAKEACEFVKKNGAWPNDAILCKQNFPDKLFCFSDYVTTVQGLPSTTSL